MSRLLQHVISVKLDVLFQLPGSEPLVGEKLNQARKYILSRLDLLRQKQQDHLGDGGLVKRASPTTAADGGYGKKSNKQKANKIKKKLHKAAGGSSK